MEEHMPSTEFVAVMTQDKAFAEEQCAAEREKGHEVRLEQVEEMYHVVVVV